jgi:hypothetical protein
LAETVSTRAIALSNARIMRHISMKLVNAA